MAHRFISSFAAQCVVLRGISCWIMLLIQIELLLYYMVSRFAYPWLSNLSSVVLVLASTPASFPRLSTSFLLERVLSYCTRNCCWIMFLSHIRSNDRSAYVFFDNNIPWAPKGHSYLTPFERSASPYDLGVRGPRKFAICEGEECPRTFDSERHP